jgi:hypothetical protein
MRPFWVVIAVAACGSSSRPNNSDAAPDIKMCGVFCDAANQDGIVVNAGQSAVYAHTATSLYRVDPDTYVATKVGDFGLTGILEVMTDLGIDQNGMLVGVSFSSVYSVDVNTGHATLLSSGSLLQQFNGLSFVPAAAVGQTGADVLIGTNNANGSVYRVNPTTGVTSVIGSMGGAFTSSGDVVSVDGFGTVQTVPGASHDVLVRLADNTFTATPIGTNTGFDKIYGLGFWKGKVFGFTYTGQIITIDPTTGVGTQVASSGLSWNGAAVTTTAPIIP